MNTIILKKNMNSLFGFRDTPIYCLMITGKTSERREFAKIAIENFKIQTYKQKYMIIINEGPTSVLKRDESIWSTERIIEVMIDKNRFGLTLGGLRNMSLELVPPDAIWTTWDDDDWRIENYLEVLYKKLTSSSGRNLLFQNRLEHNFNTGFSWKVKLNNGTPFFFAYKDPTFRYDKVNFNEDVVVKFNMLEKVKYGETVIYDNDPKIYIRFVHNDNTSIYVNPRKHNIRNVPNHNNKPNNVLESETSSTDNRYINNVLKRYKSLKK